MRRKRISIFSILVILAVLTSNLWGVEKTTDHTQRPNIIKLNNILVDKANKEIRISAKLAIVEGILEYLLVGNHGKTYESVFKVGDNKPSELNFALLLIGCTALDFDEFLRLKNKGNWPAKLSVFPKQSLLEVEITQDGKKFGLQRLLKDRENSGRPFIWVYTGGLLLKDHGYAGDLEFSYIGIWPDRVAVINLLTDLKNPYQGNFGFEINKALAEKLEADQIFEIVIRGRH